MGYDDDLDEFDADDDLDSDEGESDDDHAVNALLVIHALAASHSGVWCSQDNVPGY